MDIQPNTVSLPQSIPIHGSSGCPRTNPWTSNPTQYLSHSPIQSTGPLDVLGLSMDIQPTQYLSHSPIQSTGPLNVLGLSTDIQPNTVSLLQSTKSVNIFHWHPVLHIIVNLFCKCPICMNVPLRNFVNWYVDATIHANGYWQCLYVRKYIKFCRLKSKLCQARIYNLYEITEKWISSTCMYAKMWGGRT